MGLLTESNIIIFILFGLIALVVYNQKLYNKQTNADNNIDQCNFENFSKDVITKKHHRSHKIKKSHKKHTLDPKNALDVLSRVSKIPSKQSKKQFDKQSQHAYSKNHKTSQEQQKSEFLDNQYHQDYIYTITAINNLTPQKELFNLGFLPVVETTPASNIVKKLTKMFISKVNNEIDTDVQEFLHTNSGWGDMGKRRRTKSGFEEAMEDLGLPGTTYNEPAKKSKLILIKVDKAEQYNTDEQIRFIIYMVVQNENVKDHMVLQVKFFMERGDLSGSRDDRDNFFEKELTNYDKKDTDHAVIIEQALTVGYLTNAGNKKTKMDKFHDYDGVHKKDGLMDQNKVLDIMVQKHNDRLNELQSFKGTLDEELRDSYEHVDTELNRRSQERVVMDDLAKFN